MYYKKKGEYYVNILMLLKMFLGDGNKAVPFYKKGGKIGNFR